MTEDMAVRWLHPTRTGGLSVPKSSSYDGLVLRSGTFMARRQSGALVEMANPRGRQTSRRTRPANPSSNRSSTATNSVRWVGLPTAGVAGNGNGGRPAGRGHEVVFRFIVNPRRTADTASRSARAGGSHVSVRPPALSRPVQYERATGEDTLAVFTPAGSNPEWVRPASIGRWKTTTGRSARRFERSAPANSFEAEPPASRSAGLPPPAEAQASSRGGQRGAKLHGPCERACGPRAEADNSHHSPCTIAAFSLQYL